MISSDLRCYTRGSLGAQSVDRERWRQIEEIYQSAAERTPEERDAFLAVACGGDEELRREVESLLAQQSQDTPLDRPAWELAAGASLGPYELLEPIGQGGMGTVFKARDTRLNRSVAIKVSAAQFSGRFANEARAVAALNHPHVCTLHDVGPNYLVMEFVEGENLAQRLEKGALPLDQTLRYGVEIADAVAAAHARGIVHRDLKPGNIMLTKSGVKVLDFGLAKFAEPASPGPAQTATPRHRRHGGVHVAGTGRGQAGGCAERHLQPRRGALRDGDRQAPVPARYGDGDAGGGGARGARTAFESRPGHAGGVGANHRALPAQGSRTAVPDGSRPQGRTGGAEGGIGVGQASGLRRAPASPPALALDRHRHGRGACRHGKSGCLDVHPSRSSQRTLPADHDGFGAEGVAGTLGWIAGLLRFHLSFGENRLMQVPVSGGQPTVVSHSLPGSKFALLDMSPDGEELLMLAQSVQTAVAFTVLSPLWAVRVSDGRARRIGLGTTSGARYSPDGKRIVWSNREKLYVAAANGSEAREIASIPGSDLIMPSWITPERISLVRVEQQGSAMQAWVIAPDGSGFRRLLPHWERPHSLPALTPDGRFMLLHSAGMLWSVAVPRWPAAKWGGTPTQLTFGTPYVYAPHRIRDGRMFALGEIRTGELQRFDLRTRTWQRHLGGISADGVAYSPDGQWVAYVLYPEQSLWRCRADGTERLQLVDGSIGAYLPRWSPDGKVIAFQAMESDKSWSRFSQVSSSGAWRIWLVNADGSNLRPAAPSHAGSQGDPAWTADGKRLIFSNYRFSTGDPRFLESLDIESGQVTKVPGTDGLWSPQSSPDYSRLLAVDSLGSSLHNITLTILDPATGQWKKASDEIANFPRWAPDNKSIIYENGKEIRRFRLDTWKAETIVPLDRWHDIDANLHYGWIGQDAGGAPLVMRNRDVRQVYELEFAAKVAPNPDRERTLASFLDRPAGDPGHPHMSEFRPRTATVRAGRRGTCSRALPESDVTVASLGASPFTSASRLTRTM